MGGSPSTKPFVQEHSGKEVDSHIVREEYYKDSVGVVCVVCVCGVGGTAHLLVPSDVSISIFLIL